MIQQAVRFGLVGAANTIVGYAVVLAALAAGFGDYAANAMGYAVGLLLGFALNRQWAFASAGQSSRLPGRRQIPLYVAAFALSYGLNLAVLTVLRMGEVISSPVAQLAAMAAYTASFFLLCRHFVFTEDRSWLKRLLSSPGIVLAAIALAGAPLVANMPVSHDVVWQMWIARQMNHGARLYVDIVEINPPLWFWMGLAMEKLGVVLGCSPAALLKLTVWLWAALSAQAVGLLSPKLAARRRTALTLVIFALCTLMPLHNYGQREHLVLIAALPYAFLLAARARGFRPDPRLVVAVSTAAALGFALKHYFVLMPALGELWLLFRLKRNYQPVRAETAVLVGLAALYGGAVALWAKPFLTNIVPLVRLAYGGYESPFIEQVNKPEQVVWLMAALCFARYGRPKNPDARNLAEILLISAGAFVFAYFAQQKGWPYHAIPATGMAVAAVFSAMILPLSGDRRLGRSLLPMVTCVLPLFLGAAEGPYANGNARSFNSAVHGMAPGSTFLAITTRPSWTWPMIESDKLLWPSRYFAFWMFDSIGVDEASDHADPAMRQLGEEVVRNTAEDMRCNPPQRVLVEGVPTNSGLRSVNFRMLPFFEHDAEFVEIMRHYRRTEHSPVYDLFELASPYGREKGDRCRDIA